ncbi:Phosphatidylserine/phosphatidylglycerophosphate/cardiolipin synthase [Pseudomonas lini]|uniref:Phosphatidylserine/phosphatidylglycerophosphate/cardiolipin synthase n=2 Tax=Pseudomonas lini TaxID=163011 RepID=A0A0L1P5U2_9PSED|nr:phospholipase [Pseudomonas lini]SDT20666.1 Phosphatidylserine/phosphatidylglycerophosphate/cardiolipin synthase [Pseudomonas lini]
MPMSRFFPAMLLALLLAGCATTRLPHDFSEAIPASDSAFGRSIQAQAAQHEGRSGFRLLPNSSEAFRARAELIRNAQKSVDLQYYIVHNGLSTRALVREILLAADRGVRIRMLLDDTASDGQEEVIATLAVHQNIYIRVFNPLHLGRSTMVTRTMGRLLNLSQQHRRMHNKLWLADNSAAIVGGRNLGDEYFDAKPDLNFTDMDLLCIGPVAEQLGHSFDQYWNSALSQPISDFLLNKPTAEDLLKSRQRLEQSLQTTRIENTALYDHLMTYRTQPQLENWRKQLIWAHSKAMWDAPSKVLADDEPARALLMATQLRPELDSVSKELIMISAYFVPQKPGMLYLLGRADAGVDVRLLTNSLEATDVPAVHGGYAPYRKTLLEHGVKLYEVRRQPDDPSGGSSFGFSGGSDSSLHTKAMILDKQKVFIGSFNFDPRSVLWNTEVGVLVDSPELAGYMRKLALEGMVPAVSYQARLENGEVVWVTEDDGRLHTLHKEPGGKWRSFKAWLSDKIGLEKML